MNGLLMMGPASWLKAVARRLEAKSESGMETLEYVVLAAIVLVAVAAIASLIVGVMNGWLAKIPV